MILNKVCCEAKSQCIPQESTADSNNRQRTVRILMKACGF